MISHIIFHERVHVRVMIVACVRQSTQRIIIKSLKGCWMKKIDNDRRRGIQWGCV